MPWNDESNRRLCRQTEKDAQESGGTSEKYALGPTKEIPELDSGSCELRIILPFRGEKRALENFKARAKTASMKRGRAEAIIEQVRSVVSKWREYADQAGVSSQQRDMIRKALYLDPFR
jgi:hypothetical protein